MSHDHEPNLAEPNWISKQKQVIHGSGGVSIWCCCLEMINSFRQKPRKLKDATSSFSTMVSSISAIAAQQKWAFKLWRHRAEEPRNYMKISPCHDAVVELCFLHIFKVTKSSKMHHQNVFKIASTDYVIQYCRFAIFLIRLF